jgi:hypothetical protein
LKKLYALEKGAPKTLEFSWGIGWKDFTIRQDGDLIGKIPDQKALKEGAEFTLKDGSRLYIKLNISIMSSGLEVLRNGIPIEGSDADPGTRVKGCFGLLLFVAVLDILGAAMVVLSSGQEASSRADSLMYGFIFLFFGFAYIILALSIRKGSLTALYIAISVMVLEVLTGIVLLTMSGNMGSFFWAIIRALVIIYLITSIKFFKEESKTGLT